MLGRCLLTVLLACPPLLADDPERASPANPSVQITPVQSPSAEVTYVANEGFLVLAGDRKIAVDVFFEGETINWCDAPGPETVRHMRNASGEFEGVDLILITHWHVDHVTPSLLLAHLASNQRAVVVASPQVVSKLRGDAAWSGAFGPRIREIDIPLFGSRRLSFEGIDVEVHRIRHGSYPIKDEATGKERNKHENVENLAYLVDAGGARFMHFGDALLKENGDYFDGKHFTRREVDIAFAEDWSDEALGIFDRLLDPGTVVFMHMPPDPDRIERISRHVGSKIPNAVIFRNMMDSRSLPVRTAASDLRPMAPTERSARD